MKFIWMGKTGASQSGCTLYLNRIRVAGYSWNSSRPQSKIREEPDWTGYIDLPSLKNKGASGNTEDEIKARIEKVVTDWFKEVGK